MRAQPPNRARLFSDRGEAMHAALDYISSWSPGVWKLRVSTPQKTGVEMLTPIEQREASHWQARGLQLMAIWIDVYELADKPALATGFAWFEPAEH